MNETRTEPTDGTSQGGSDPVLTPYPIEHRDGFSDELAGDSTVDARLDAIEMAGEEVAVGWKPSKVPPLAPEVRYLHISRTINQLITDRNRSVGIFLGVASLLFAASTALLNASKDVVPIVPIAAIQYWCLPATFGTLAVIAAYISLLLIRARIGLIYEVTKMNVLLGLDSKRVERVNPLSIFYLMHLLVVTLGAISAGLTVGMMLHHYRFVTLVAQGCGVATTVSFLAFFQAVYYLTILRHTSEAKLSTVKS